MLADRFIALAALVGGLSAAAPAMADAPPYNTTDTDVAEAPEFSAFFQSSSAGRAQATSLGLDLALPLAPRWELSLVPRITETGEGGRVQAGWGDTEIAIKYLAQVETPSGPAISFEPSVTLPTGGDRRGDGWASFELPVLISRAYGPWRFSGQVGYAREGGGSVRDYAPISLLVERSLAGRFSVGAEIASEVILRRPDRSEVETNLGGTWTIRDGVRLAAVVGRRTSNRDERAELHGGLAVDVAL